MPRRLKTILSTLRMSKSSTESDVELVMQQTLVSYGAAKNALAKFKGDVVEAIVWLTVSPPQAKLYAPTHPNAGRCNEPDTEKNVTPKF
jgi:HYPK-like protein